MRNIKLSESLKYTFMLAKRNSVKQAPDVYMRALTPRKNDNVFRISVVHV